MKTKKSNVIIYGHRTSCSLFGVRFSWLLKPNKYKFEFRALMNVYIYLYSFPQCSAFPSLCFYSWSEHCTIDYPVSVFCVFFNYRNFSMLSVPRTFCLLLLYDFIKCDKFHGCCNAFARNIYFIDVCIEILIVNKRIRADTRVICGILLKFGKSNNSISNCLKRENIKWRPNICRGWNLVLVFIAYCLIENIFVKFL